MQGLRLALVIGSILALSALLWYELYGRSVYSRHYKQLPSLASTARLLKSSISNLFKRITRSSRIHRTADSANFGGTRVVRRVQEPVFGIPSDVSPDVPSDVPLPDVSNLGQEVRSEVGELAQSAMPVSQRCQHVRLSLTTGENLAPDVVAAAKVGVIGDPTIVLYVVAHQCALLYGDPLLRSVLQLGFRYGERAVFHRHLNPVGGGPVLFSLVNMVKPGTFNLSNMREFTTPGVALCMNIPAYGDTLQNFKLMLQAAQRLAYDLSGVVLDDERHLLTPQKSDYYKAYIRRLLAVRE